MKLQKLLLSATATVGFTLAALLRPVAAQVPTSALNDACTGNLNNDGAVNTTDLLIFLAGFGQTCESNISSPGAGVTFGGYNYATIVLGNGQEWMAENLRTSVYANGDPIPNVTSNSAWWATTAGAWSYYNNDSLYENPYGKLYNWYTVVDPRNACPTGWHVPSDAEWNTLIGFLDTAYNPNAEGTQSEIAGGKMKSPGTQYWLPPNQDATNETGFSGLPGGCRFYDGTFEFIGYLGGWWCSTAQNPINGWSRNLYYVFGFVARNSFAKKDGFSVRCIKN